MLAQERDDSVHAIVSSAADHRAPVFFLCDEASGDQPAEMKGERRGRYVEAGLDIGDAKAGRPGSNQQPIYVQARQIA
ncbi:hypothetical protein BDS110ZK25_08150 [Bradyrhizobium diazoefficiens]|jgi:hypothetical protein|uniref:Uncharacterized protein n=1 Tax=Bradyrhizobium diazoefficiens TaxID=1355477 RepID=A0A809WZG3_9BRAD|nr:hypothetical protein F07S3_35190 [Bradyrhizobium diazoefficiens]BCA02684.1 hypothetical protein H12S4_35880 [Bradyrhizobium diazoefficiens]BCA11436.1 hypothetical protein BDHF08_32830 [Bradyrhizobium diazoefficiens]BCA20048.1 hypothetical protein BDHH15_32630 [Bradyrhizobium diazoefficiens]BCE20657.1 hypothetical protein XF1B_33380 [Bradyrhizobium diazoefficiens]